MKQPHIDNDFIIKPFNGGVKFLRPNAGTAGMATFADMMSLSSDVCLIGRNVTAVYMNEPAVIRTGMVSLKDCLGKSIYDVANSETAHVITEHQQNTFRKKSLQIIEYDFQCKHAALIHHCLLFSTLWYQENNELGGILDLAVVSDRDNLPLSLANLMKLGLLNYSFNPAEVIQPLNLSRRETQCIELLKDGNTSKQIALQLDLSPRTIDHYLENCMNKLNVSTRAELVSEYLRRL